MGNQEMAQPEGEGSDIDKFLKKHAQNLKRIYSDPNIGNIIQRLFFRTADTGTDITDDLTILNNHLSEFQLGIKYSNDEGSISIYLVDKESLEDVENCKPILIASGTDEHQTISQAIRFIKDRAEAFGDFGVDDTDIDPYGFIPEDERMFFNRHGVELRRILKENNVLEVVLRDKDITEKNYAKLLRDLNLYIKRHNENFSFSIEPWSREGPGAKIFTFYIRYKIKDGTGEESINLGEASAPKQAFIIGVQELCKALNIDKKLYPKEHIPIRPYNFRGLFLEKHGRELEAIRDKLERLSKGYGEKNPLEFEVDEIVEEFNTILRDHGLNFKIENDRDDEEGVILEMVEYSDEPEDLFTSYLEETTGDKHEVYFFSDTDRGRVLMDTINLLLKKINAIDDDLLMESSKKRTPRGRSETGVNPETLGIHSQAFEDDVEFFIANQDKFVDVSSLLDDDHITEANYSDKLTSLSDATESVGWSLIPPTEAQTPYGITLRMPEIKDGVINYKDYCIGQGDTEISALGDAISFIREMARDIDTPKLFEPEVLHTGEVDDFFEEYQDRIIYLSGMINKMVNLDKGTSEENLEGIVEQINTNAKTYGLQIEIVQPPVVGNAIASNYKVVLHVTTGSVEYSMIIGSGPKASEALSSAIAAVTSYTASLKYDEFDSFEVISDLLQKEKFFTKYQKAIDSVYPLLLKIYAELSGEERFSVIGEDIIKLTKALSEYNLSLYESSEFDDYYYTYLVDMSLRKRIFLASSESNEEEALKGAIEILIGKVSDQVVAEEKIKKLKAPEGSGGSLLTDILKESSDLRSRLYGLVDALATEIGEVAESQTAEVWLQRFKGVCVRAKFELEYRKNNLHIKNVGDSGTKESIWISSGETLAEVLISGLDRFVQETDVGSKRNVVSTFLLRLKK